MPTPANKPFATCGTKVTIDSTEIVGIQSIGDPESDASTIDVTTLKDTEMKNIPGLKQANAIQLTCFKDQSASGANYEAARALEDGDDHDIEFEFADGSKLAFEGRVSTRLAGSQVNAAQMFYINIYKTGDSTYTPAA